MHIEDIGTVTLGFYPTPLQEMTHLSDQVGKARMFIKRDDLTGIGGGGNKLRKLEYIVKEALDQGYTTLLTYGGVQTNHGRLTAASAALYGMKSVIMCYGTPPERMSGNLVLDRMFDAELVFMDTTEVRKLPREEMVQGYYDLKDRSTQKVIERYEAQGDKVYMVPIGGHSPLGTLGYVNAVKEILDQSQKMGVQFDYLVTANGSGGTYAGLVLGAKLYGAPFKVKGLSVAPQAPDAREKMASFINSVSDHFDLGVQVTADEMDLSDEYCGPGYNQPDEVTREAM